MRRGLLGALAICVAAALWGLDGVVLTPRLHELDVLFVVFLLHAVPFVLMQPLLAGSYRELSRLRPVDWVFLLLVSLAGGILGTFSIVKALFLVNFQQLSVVVLLQKLQPVFAIVLAAILLRERISARFLGRAALALVGAYLLTFGLRAPAAAPDDRGLEAAVWALLAAASFGSATVLGKRLLGALDFRPATFGRYGVTSVMALALLLLTGRGLPLSTVTPTHWALILVIGLTTGSGAIFLYYYGLTRVRAVVSAVCELCLPLSAVVFDYWLNGSVLGGWQWLGAVLLVAAITLVTLASGRRAERSAAAA